ncbi:ABC transporter permease [Alkalibacter sp. M17DMB]|nr:ABC transporter permease [Alkalibacter mobilis]
MAVIFIFFALVAPLCAPNDPLHTDFEHVLEKPGENYLLGTDQVGRCVLSRILYGARVSLGMTFSLLGMVFIFGVGIGTVAGMSGKVVDSFITRLIDVILSFPEIVFAIGIVGIIGPGIKNTIFALSIIWWTKYARLTRVLVISIKNSEYLAAARMAGAGTLRCVFKYILPNIVSPLAVQFVLDIGNIMLALAGLSFLGLGVQPPIPEWGNMLNEGRAYLQTAPWLLLYPGLAIFLTVSLFNVLGDMTRDFLDIKNI